MIKLTQNITVVILSAFLLWRGIIPALTKVDTDFPNYYTASRLILDGRDISRIYDESWFQDQINVYGIKQEGKFSPFPPVTAFIMLPLALLTPDNALRIWTIFNIATLVLSIIFLAKSTNKSWLWTCLIFLVNGIALSNNFRFGQFYLVLTFLMLLGYYFLLRGYPSCAGVMIGLGAAFKYLPIVLLLLLFVRKEWSGILTTLLTIAVLYAFGLMIFGLEVYKHFFTFVLPEHLSGQIQNPFSSVFQSWDSLLRKIFIYDATVNPSPLFHSAAGFIIAKFSLIIIIVSISVVIFVRTEKIRADNVLAVQYALLIVTAMVLLPASATYHFLLLVVPVGILLSIEQQWNTFHTLLLGCYLVIGFMPYKIFGAFEGQGMLIVLSYSRLWTVTLMFIVTIGYVWNLTRREELRLISELT